MKWLLVLLVLLGGGVAAAALTVPTNAAVVNGAAISQETLNSDISAIANSSDYRCYLNSEDYLTSNGSQVGLPTITGAGQGQNPGDNPTANSAFVATYLDTAIGHQLLLQIAAAHHVTVTPAQLADARTSLAHNITATMGQVAQTAEGGNPEFSCGAVGGSLNGQTVLGSLPESFANAQVQFVATATALQEDLAGVGSSEGDLVNYYERHRSEFDTMCFNAAEYSSQSAANEAAAAVAYGTPFSQVASGALQSGTFPCSELVALAGELGVDMSALNVGVGQVPAPVQIQGQWVLLQLSKRTTTPYATAKEIVSEAVQQVGAQATQAAITVAERRASVTVDPRYGTWHAAIAQVYTPLTPVKTDVLNPTANEPTAAASKSPFSG